MALSPFRSKAVQHSRSLSLPSNKSHTATSHINENLPGLQGFEPSLSSMNNRVKNLNKLYSNTGDLLMLPHIQQIIVQERKEKRVDDVLDGYITLLDACAMAKDLISNTKQRVHELLSSLRRNDVEGIRSYLDCRRETKKIINKSLKDLRSKHNVPSSEKDHETTDIAFSLKETELVTFTLFESLLSYLTGAKVRRTGWSTLVPKKVVSRQGEGMHLNEFEKMDGLLQMSLEEEAKAGLKEMESSIRVLEEELECLFRRLIRTRVSLLNILNH